MEKETYEIREVNAWMYDDGWVWNDSYHYGEMKTDAKDFGKAFRKWLANKGIYFKPHRTITVYDGDIYEIRDRKTQEPLFAAIPMF